MTIDGKDISTYGLKLLKLEDYYNQPARKRNLSIPAFGVNDLKYESRQAVVKLLGKYDSYNELATSVSGFETLLKGAMKHAVIIPGHNLSFTGVAATGYKVAVKRKTVLIELKFIIDELET